MPTPVFNLDLLKEDVHASKVITNGEDTTALSNAIASEIRKQLSYHGVNADDVALDEDDFILSDALNSYLTAFGLWRLFRAYHGSARGEKDVYYDKARECKEDMMIAEKYLTKETIEANGSTGDDGEALGQDAFISIVPLYA
jgi:hypothetical protein